MKALYARKKRLNIRACFPYFQFKKKKKRITVYVKQCVHIVK